MGLRIPCPTEGFVLEAISTGTSYGGVLLQEDVQGKLWPVACVSTTNTWVAKSEAEDALAAVLYSIRKFKDLLRLTPHLKVMTPIPGLSALSKSRDHGARLQSVLGEIVAYSVTFVHDSNLRNRVQQSLE